MIENNKYKRMISARQLYLELGLDKTHWSRWSRRNIINSPFFKNIKDYNVVELVINGNKTTDCMISLDFACHLINSAKSISSDLKINILDKYMLKDKIDIIGRREVEFFNFLEKVLKPFECDSIKQYSCCNNKYRIDLYIPKLNVAIEYDEDNHLGYTYEQHDGRQKEIEKELGCKFIRVSDNNSDEYNIGQVIKQMLCYNKSA